MIRTPSQKILINSLDADTVKVVDGVVYIQGFGSFKPSDVKSCYKSCPSDAQRKVVRTRIVIPENCDCPVTVGLTVRSLLDLTSYDTKNTFPVSRLYEYTDPNGATPTAVVVAAALVARINADENAPVTAVQTDAAGTADAAGTYITFTSKTDSDNFNIFNSMDPTQPPTVVTAFVRVKLSATDMKQLFPIQPGDFGGSPNLPNCGIYCVYHFVIRNCCPATSPPSDGYDVSTDRQYLAQEAEVHFFVNNTLENFDDDWNDILVENITCLEPASS